MKPFRSWSNTTRLAAVFALTLVPTAVRSDEAPRPPAQPNAAPGKLDVGKRVIELPVKGVIAGKTAAPAAAPMPLRDITKGEIERPAKAVVQVNSGAAASVNPKVQPGRVQWHPTFEAACAASQKSHKPVLLFQMMGKLDDQFC
jgi:hypothetical protein